MIGIFWLALVSILSPQFCLQFGFWGIVPNSSTPRTRYSFLLSMGRPSFGRLIGDAMSRVFNFYVLTVKFFTSKLHKSTPYNFLKFVQFATCIFSFYLLYSYQEVRETSVAQGVMCRYPPQGSEKGCIPHLFIENRRKELIQWQSTNGGIIF